MDIIIHTPLTKKTINKKSNQFIEENHLIIEFTTMEEGSLIPVSAISRIDKNKLKERSVIAMDKAMDIIQNMSDRINSKVKEMEGSPDNIDIEFGIKFDAEIGIILAKSSLEASLNIKLNWKNLNKSETNSD